MKKLAIIGSGDLGQQIAHHARSDSHFQVIGFFDDYHPKGEIKGNNLPILGSTDSIEKFYNNQKFDVLMIGIGYNHFEQRERLYEKFVNIVPFGTIIHSSAHVDPTSSIGQGVIIYPGCVVDMQVQISDNVLINIGCTIAHDSIIDKHSFLSPAVNLAGFVTVGKKVNLGINTTVIDNIKIGANVRTGGGAVITENLTKAGLYVGVPAKLKKV